MVLEGKRLSSTTTAEEEADGGEKEDSDRAAAVGFMAADPEVGTRVAAAIRNAPAILAGVHRSAPPKQLEALLDRLFSAEVLYLFVH